MKKVKFKLPDKTLRNAHRKSPAKALSIFLTVLCFSFVTLYSVLIYDTIWIKLAFSVLNGFFISILFVVGHDASHQSLFNSILINNFVSRISFLPTFHPLTTWDLGHNKYHHCFTNLSGKDYVWRPFSFEEFKNLSNTRKMMEKVYRTFFGVGLYYFIEIWLKHLVFPGKNDIKKIKLKCLIYDWIVILLYLFILLVFIKSYSKDSEFILNSFLAVIVPFSFWNWLMGFVIFQHHTHPRIVWYDNFKDWALHHTQLEGTVHILFPWPVNLFLLNIMEHTAHHIDAKIPLYNLLEVQKFIQKENNDDIIQVIFSFKNFINTLNECKLFNYREKQWEDFNGKSTESIR